MAVMRTLVGVVGFIALSTAVLYLIDFLATKIRLLRRSQKTRQSLEYQPTGYFAVTGVSTEFANYLNGEYMIMSEGRRFRQIDLIQH